ncbi:MAG TPA: hypothetical protein VGL53_12055 [Bryobacteraceae bacterium]
MFTGVEGYHFEADAFGNIVLDLTSVPIARFLSDFGDDLSKWSRFGALGIWASDLDTASTFLEEHGTQAFVLAASLGLSGWILANGASVVTAPKASQEDQGNPGGDETVTLTIGKDEALILFESLAEFNEETAIPINDSADRLAFVRLGGVLESTLVEPFMKDYGIIVDDARKRLIEVSGERE